MNTVVKDWIIVSVLDKEQLIGEVLYGTVIDDMTCRFASGDYVDPVTHFAHLRLQEHLIGKFCHQNTSADEISLFAPKEFL